MLDLLGAGPLLTPNASELADLARRLGHREPSRRSRAAEEVETLAQTIAERTGASLVVTLGGDGALVVAPDGTVDRVPARAVEARDTTGAGDTFNGVLASRLAVGEPLSAAVRAATIAASASVAHVGARGRGCRAPRPS